MKNHYRSSLGAAISEQVFENRQPTRPGLFNVAQDYSGSKDDQPHCEAERDKMPAMTIILREEITIDRAY
jgi:hypothetical protein